MHNDWENKICLITDIISKDGLELANFLANLKAQLIFIDDEKARGEKLCEELKNNYDNPNIFFIRGDLAILASVYEIVDEIRTNFDTLDILINSKYIFNNEYKETINYTEQMFSINYLSRFLLTNLCLPILANSQNPLIINLISDIDTKSNIDFSDLQNKWNFSAVLVNKKTSLMNVLFNNYLLTKIQKKNKLKIFCINTKGHNNSSFTSKLKGFLPKAFSKDKNKLTKITNQIFFNNSDELDQKKLYYFKGSNLQDITTTHYDPNVAHKLWSASIQLINSL